MTFKRGEVPALVYLAGLSVKIISGFPYIPATSPLQSCFCWHCGISALAAINASRLIIRMAAHTALMRAASGLCFV